MERLGRGVVAIRQNSTQVYVGWRMLGTDSENISFNVYRITSGATNLLNGSPITNSCNFADTGSVQALAHSYFVQPIMSGVTQAISASFTMPAGAPVQPYLSLPLQVPAGGIAADGVGYTYNANDCSAGDLNGDGEYEIVLKWDPSNSKDNSQSGFTGKVFLDAYKLDGTRLWRIDLGPNIRAGAHYTQFMVYDLDGDGRAEVACKTAPGTKDGLGNNVILPGDNPSTVYTNSSGYILSGPEYFTIFDGLTGANLATTNYIVPRGSVSAWGDNYGNRVDRFLACVAYLDGVRPSVVMCRGYYTRAVLCAWDWRNGQLTQRWLFDTGNSGGPWSGYKGQGAHSLTVGDVDADGRDEITYGACGIDDNGTGLYTTGLGHGDALHLSDMNPDRPGLEVWMVHESPNSYGLAGLEFRDARTGSLIFGVDGQNTDIGRGVAIDIDPRFRGYEMWGSRGGLMSATGVQISSSRPSPMNFACWWDADLLRELLDGTTISKWNWNSGTTSSLLAPGGIASNNGTKATPALSADILGDWREEVIWRSSGNNELRIYTAATVATNRLYTLMHDSQYRLAIAWQNVAYNQPPHPGFYIGPDMYPPPLALVSDAQLVWRGGMAGNVWDASTTSNWFVNGVWSNHLVTTFAQENSVLFDLRGSNNTTVNLAGSLSPARVTVHSPSDYTFAGGGSLAGAARLFKAGPGRLTINNTNHYTGVTLVSAGELFINGTLSGSPVTMERRGTPEGPPRIGGGGRLGQGLTVQPGCHVVVGPAVNIAGALTVSNAFTELGNVTNHFDLSSDPGAGGANDRVEIFGNLTLNGTNIIEINQLNGFLGGGLYTLFSYTGNLTGGLTNLLLIGDFIQPVTLTNPPGAIALLASMPAEPPTAPSGLAATTVGAFQINLAWMDNATNENAFLIERSVGNTNSFVQIATVGPNVTDFSDLGLSPMTAYSYRVRGTNLAGFSGYSPIASATTSVPAASLTWRGDGAGNAWDLAATANWFDGANLVAFTDGTDVTFNQSGSNNVPVSLSGDLRPDSVAVNASKNYTFDGSGSLAGPMALVKSGPGTLTINTANSFSGGVTVNAGTLTLGSTTGAGTGPLRFNGGTVNLVVGSQQTYGNALIVAANSTLTSAGGNNNIVNGAWSGTNTTLNVGISSSGTFTISGNMTNFFGTLALGNSGGFCRFNGSSGGPNTIFDLGNGTSTLNNRNGVTIILGALSGGSGTFLSGAGAVDAPSTYLVGSRNSNSTFSGTIRDASAQRTTSINKIGTGAWTLTGSNTYSGPTTLSSGTLLVNGSHSGATGAVTVNANGTLGGSGTIAGNTVVNGTLSPGAPLGTLTFNGHLTLATGGHAYFEVSKSPFTNDAVRVLGNVTYGGTLNVVNTSVELLEAGDNFRLFEAAGYGGSFGSHNLPALEEGLDWNTSRLNVDGRLWVVSTQSPVIDVVNVVGGNVTFSGTGGTPGWYYFVLASTNVSVPLPQWTRVATNHFDAAGSFTSALEAVVAHRFYLLQIE